MPNHPFQKSPNLPTCFTVRSLELVGALAQVEVDHIVALAVVLTRGAQTLVCVYGRKRTRKNSHDETPQNTDNTGMSSLSQAL